MVVFLFSVFLVLFSFDFEEVVADNSEEYNYLVLIADFSSQGLGVHEFCAGVMLMERCLASVQGLKISSFINGWPPDISAFNNADAIHLFMDGGQRHPVIQEDRLQLMQKLIDKGVGFGAMHYALEVPKDNGGEQFVDWIGGYYETYYSVNPLWTSHFGNLPNHPILRGVEPFSIRDEWYFSIRFREDKVGITPLLVDAPLDETRDGPYVHPPGPYDHILEQKGKSEIVSWVVERKDGGRGFGFTGGHYHVNWGNDGFRKFVLNALVWLAGLDVLSTGVQCEITQADLEEYLDE